MGEIKEKENVLTTDRCYKGRSEHDRNAGKSKSNHIDKCKNNSMTKTTV